MFVQLSAKIGIIVLLVASGAGLKANHANAGQRIEDWEEGSPSGKINFKRQKQCLAGIETFKQELRAAGFDIPANGENVNRNTESYIEGGTSDSEIQFLMEVATEDDLPVNGSVCQTGFNYGTSAYAFLCSTDKSVHVHSWDLGDHPYVNAAHELINKKFPNRHHITLGDSRQTLPSAKDKMLKQCDFVFVDGGHTMAMAYSDIKNFRAIAKPDARLVIDDCGSDKRVWRGMLQAREDKLINMTNSRNVIVPAVFPGTDGVRRVCAGKYVPDGAIKGPLPSLKGAGWHPFPEGTYKP